MAFSGGTHVTSSSSTPYVFERFGKAYHLRIKDASDLAKVLDLDEALWLATDAPIETINADRTFLELLDTTHDGRVRAREVKQAIQWLLDHLKQTAAIQAGNMSLELDAINREREDGQKIYGAAFKILHRLNLVDESHVTLEQVRRIQSEDRAGGLDKAGLVLPEAADDPAVQQIIRDIIATVGGEPHPKGVPGVTLARLEQFLRETQVYLDWLARAELSGPAESSSIMPLGKDTPAAYSLLAGLREKFDQYFALSDLLRLNPAMADRFKPREADLDKLDLTKVETLEEFLAQAPLAAPKSDRALQFEGTLNPHYAKAVEEFRIRVLASFLGNVPEEMTKDEWRAIKGRFEAHEAWLQTKPQVHVENLPADQLKQHLENTAALDAVRGLLEASHRTAFDLKNLCLLEKLILFQSCLLPFLNSFVSFPDLYHEQTRALFEMGTLVMDGRHFNLAVKVLDRAEHAKFSDASNMFMLYVEVSETAGQKLYEVAVPVTAGTKGNLLAGKWGVFHDLQGRELHARVVQIVQNPISLGEAMLAPFVRLGRAVSAKFEEKASKAENVFVQSGTGAISGLATPPPKPARPAPPRTQRTTGGLIAGGGIAVAALGSSAAFVVDRLSDLTWRGLLTGLLSAGLAVLLPVTIVALVKLARRDLSAVLEGSGWAINSRMRLSRRQADTFTRRPSHPAGSIGIVGRNPWLWIVLAVLVILAAGWHYLLRR